MTTPTLADRLLAVLPPYERHADTLRAVVELHKPYDMAAAFVRVGDGPWAKTLVEQREKAGLIPAKAMCLADGEPQAWPCPTILAVADGLGVEARQ